MIAAIAHHGPTSGTEAATKTGTGKEEKRNPPGVSIALMLSRRVAQRRIAPMI
jgi:hypothetical protein